MCRAVDILAMIDLLDIALRLIPDFLIDPRGLVFDVLADLAR